MRLAAVRIEIAGKLLIPPLNLEIAPGEIVTVMGPSGSGKSTLLALIGGLIDRAFTAEGRIWIGGTDVTAAPPEHRGVGFLFQDDLLFPHLTVAANLAFGLTSRVRCRRQRSALLEAALARADLAGFGSRDPTTLSGGQRQRVSLLRTLLSEPRALLLDEPFSRLDTALRHELRAFVFHHVRRRELPTLLVTHDPADAEAAGGAIVDLSQTEPGLVATSTMA